MEKTAEFTGMSMHALFHLVANNRVYVTSVKRLCTGQVWSVYTAGCHQAMNLQCLLVLRTFIRQRRQIKYK